MRGKKHQIGFVYAWNGLVAAAKTEKNLQIHLIVAVLVVLAGFYFRVSVVEWTLLIIVIGFVLMAELTNTAIEKMIDYLKPEIHPVAMFIKDIAAGSVLIAAVTAVAIGIIVFIPKFIIFFE